MLIAESELNKKIRSIRTQFSREYAKVKKRKTGKGAKDIYICKWVHFEKLLFLKDYVVPKTSSSNLPVSYYLL